MRRVIALTAGTLAALLVLRLLAFGYGRSAEPLYEGDRGAQRALAEGVRSVAVGPVNRTDFSTGSDRYDGEWLFATRMMAAVGLAQVAHEHPELASPYAPYIDASLRALVSSSGSAFDREAWGAEPLDDLGSERAHVAYLGYLALAIAVSERVHPETPHAALLVRIVEHLVPLYEASSIGLLETYPGEIYPVDNSAFFGALGLYDGTHGTDHGNFLVARIQDLRARYRDPTSGLLIQSVAPDGAEVDGPRASGTALAAYYLSFVDPVVSRDLYDALRRNQLHQTLGFGTTAEYPAGRSGWGDVDSGPVLLGQGVSATGFTLALARTHGDRDTYRATWATTNAVGGATPAGRGTRFALGGPLGDALLFAMATAQPAGSWVRP